MWDPVSLYFVLLKKYMLSHEIRHFSKRMSLKRWWLKWNVIMIKTLRHTENFNSPEHKLNFNVSLLHQNSTFFNITKSHCTRLVWLLQAYRSNGVLLSGFVSVHPGTCPEHAGSGPLCTRCAASSLLRYCRGSWERSVKTKRTALPLFVHSIIFKFQSIPK